MYRAAVCGARAVTALPTRAQAQTPVPVIQNLQVNAKVSYDSTTEAYTYQYSVTNPSSDTGNVSLIQVDITTDAPIKPPQIANPIPEYRSACSSRSLQRSSILVAIPRFRDTTCLSKSLKI